MTKTLNKFLFLAMLVFPSIAFSQEEPPSISLSWKDNSDNEDGFTLQRKEGEGGFIEIASLPKNATTYKDSTIELNVEYTYRVAAFNRSGSSDFSNEAKGGIYTIPNAPSILELKLNTQ